MKEELRKVVKNNILDMSFEEEVVREMEDAHEEPETVYKADEDALEGDNEGLKRLAKILLRLSDCMDKVKKTKGLPQYFEFYVPGET